MAIYVVCAQMVSRSIKVSNMISEHTVVTYLMYCIVP